MSSPSPHASAHPASASPLTLQCPQCAAPLPRLAMWRFVTCEYCGSPVTRATRVVTRERFRQALLRQQAKAGYTT